jgi:hypothetical protein
MGVREIRAEEMTNTVRQRPIPFWDMVGLRQCLEVDDDWKGILRNLSLSCNTP